MYRETSMLAIERSYKNQFGGTVALYVVHNHDMAGGKWVRTNNVEHWHAARLLLLSTCGHEGRPQHTYYNGSVSKEPVRMKYYPYKLFKPITAFLFSDGVEQSAPLSAEG